MVIHSYIHLYIYEKNDIFPHIYFSSFFTIYIKLFDAFSLFFSLYINYIYIKLYIYLFFICFLFFIIHLHSYLYSLSLSQTH